MGFIFSSLRDSSLPSNKTSAHDQSAALTDFLAACPQSFVGEGYTQDGRRSSAEKSAPKKEETLQAPGHHGLGMRSALAALRRGLTVPTASGRDAASSSGGLAADDAGSAALVQARRTMAAQRQRWEAEYGSGQIAQWGNGSGGPYLLDGTEKRKEGADHVDHRGSDQNFARQEAFFSKDLVASMRSVERQKLARARMLEMLVDAHEKLVELTVLSKKYLSYLLQPSDHPGYIWAIRSLMQLIDDLAEFKVARVSDALSRLSCVVGRVLERLPEVDFWSYGRSTGPGLTYESMKCFPGAYDAREAVCTSAASCQGSMQGLHEAVAAEPEAWARLLWGLARRG